MVLLDFRRDGEANQTAGLSPRIRGLQVNS